VIRPLFDLRNRWNGEPRTLPNFRRVLRRNLAKLSHRLAGEHFNLEPNLKLTLIRPNSLHLWPGITIDHQRKVKAGGLSGKRFSAIRKSSEGYPAEAIKLPLRKNSASRYLGIVEFNCSTDPSAYEPPVVLDAYLATRKKVRDGRDRFLGAFSARTYRQDEITERKSGAWLQDLVRFIHFAPVSTKSNSDAIVGCEYLVHARRAVIHFLCTLKLTVERHFCSIFEHKKFSRAAIKTHRFLKSLRQPARG
jgi:hypothetical protein